MSGQRCIVTEKNEKYSTISTEYSKKNRDIRYAAIVTDVYREPRYGETVIVFDVVYAPGNNLFGRHEVYAGALIGNRAHPSKMIISKARDEDWQDILKSKYEELNVRKQCAISFMDFYFAYKSKSDEDEDDDDDDEEEDERET